MLTDRACDEGIRATCAIPSEPGGQTLAVEVSGYEQSYKVHRREKMSV